VRWAFEGQRGEGLRAFEGFLFFSEFRGVRGGGWRVL